jgi:hypothetical protein
MTRPLQINVPGVWHHVMNRGLGGCKIFRDDEDRGGFLDLLGKIAQGWDVWPCAFCRTR